MCRLLLAYRVDARSPSRFLILRRKSPLITLAKGVGFLRLVAHFIKFMELNYAHAILALAPPPSASGNQSNPKAQMVQTFGMLALMGVMFYFLLIRPQQKKAKDHAAMLKTVRPGDRIVTTGGVFGVVLTVKEKTLTIRSADAKLEITKSAIAEITERGGESSAD